jgi:small basic protein
VKISGQELNIGRVVVGFVGASFASTGTALAIFLIVEAFDKLRSIWRPPEIPGTFSFVEFLLVACGLVLVVTLLTSICIGPAVLWLLMRKNWTRRWQSVISGACLGILTTVVIGALIAHLDRLFEEGILFPSLILGFNAVCGAMAGRTFWRIVFRPSWSAPNALAPILAGDESMPGLLPERQRSN